MAAGLPIEQSGFAQTQRRDLWWLNWFMYFAGLGFFLIVYPTWALLQNAHFRFDNYLSPFYSPELYGSTKAWLGADKAPFNLLQLQRLKKRKLSLKDRISFIEDTLTPDIIA